MEENKVVLKLEEYINLIKENETLKIALDNKENNYISLCKYVKEEVKSSARYHLENLEKDFDLGDKLISKLKDYNYKSIVDYFIKVGITYDLIEQLTDELIKESREKNNE